MIDEAKRAKQIYELFCKLSARHVVKKRGTVVCCNSESADQAEAAQNFYAAILAAQNNDTLESLMLDAFRELTSRQSQFLCDQLKGYCLQQQALCKNDDEIAIA